MTLTQRLRDEEPEFQKVRAHLEVEPPRAWYYRISPNFRTMVILLQIDLAFSDKPEIVCEGYYKTKNMVFSSRCWTLSLVARSDSLINS